MRLVDAAKPFFARHETFHPRYGWFRKAYAAVERDPGMFTREDAPIELGVGKNMVRAIRFWGTAAKLIEEHPDSRRGRSANMVRTRLGYRLFGEEGWDPYMEEPATLWLLHWLLLASPCHLPVWWLAFNEFHAVEFNDGELEQVIGSQLEVAAGWRTPHASSIRKDVRALLRTYTRADHGTRTPIHDILDCPFRELRLLGRSEATGRYRFVTGPKPSLPPSVVGYAAMDHVDRAAPTARTITFDRLAREPGGPGRAFRVTESGLRNAMSSVAAASPKIELATVAGVSQLTWSGDPADIALELLADHYGRMNDVPRLNGATPA